MREWILESEISNLLLRERVAEAQAEKEIMKAVADQIKQEEIEENKKKIEKVQEIKEGIQEAKQKILEEKTRTGASRRFEYDVILIIL